MAGFALAFCVLTVGAKRRKSYKISFYTSLIYKEESHCVLAGAAVVQISSQVLRFEGQRTRPAKSPEPTYTEQI